MAITKQRVNRARRDAQKKHKLLAEWEIITVEDGKYMLMDDTVISKEAYDVIRDTKNVITIEYVNWEEYQHEHVK